MSPLDDDPEGKGGGRIASVLHLFARGMASGVQPAKVDLNFDSHVSMNIEARESACKAM
jgi:hypothetical protein